MKKKIILTFPLKKETGKMLFHVTNNRASPFTLRSYHRTIVSRSRGNKGEKKKKNKKRRGGGEGEGGKIRTTMAENTPTPLEKLGSSASSLESGKQRFPPPLPPRKSWKRLKP